MRKELLKNNKKLMTSGQSVLFVTSQLRQREIKMAYGLKSLGWTVGLIYYDVTPFNPNECFDFTYVINSAKKAYKLARKLAPRLIHVFSGAVDDYVILFCEHKIAPVVIDLNDIFAPSLMAYCHERFIPTKNALALADGFCARDLQVKYSERMDSYTIPKQIVFFPEYCWEDRCKLLLKKSKEDVHVVSVGTVSLETHGMYDCCYLKLIKLFLDQKIHFHIYPPWSYRKDYFKDAVLNFKRDYADFLELQKNSSYLHIHDSLPTEKLISELQCYDFGVISGGFEGFGQKYTHFKPAYVRSCYSGRIADYLDAQLPILINDEVVFDFWLLKRYGVCVDLKGITNPEFKSKLQALKHNAELRSRVKAATNKLSIKKNALRLAKFYSDLMLANPIEDYRGINFYYIFKKLSKVMPKSRISSLFFTPD